MSKSVRRKRSLRGKRVMVAMALSGFMFLTTGFTEKNLTQVEILVDGQRIETSATTLTPEKILANNGITLGDKDEYQLEQAGTNAKITVYRTMMVTIERDGIKQEILTAKPTVEEVLKEQGYNLADIEPQPGFTAKTEDNLHIIINKSAAKLAAEKAEAERLEAERLAAEKAAQKVDTANGQLHYETALTMEASAYLPTDGGGDCITATGMVAQRGVAAVDPGVIPLGTRLYIPGYGEAIAADTGGAIRGHMIDLCMEDYGEAIQFGRRDITVYVLD